MIKSGMYKKNENKPLSPSKDSTFTYIVTIRHDNLNNNSPTNIKTQSPSKKPNLSPTKPHHPSSKQNYMTFRTVNKSITILDITNHKQIYSQTQVQLTNKHIFVEELIVGKAVDVFIKSDKNKDKDIVKVEILGYGDEFTKKYLAKQMSQVNKALIMIKPGFIQGQNKKFGEIFQAIHGEFDSDITRFKMFVLSKENLEKYIINDKMQNLDNNKQNMDYLMSEPCFAFQVQGNNLLIRIKRLLGSENPIDAKKLQMFSLRAKYGTNLIYNCCYGSKTQKGAEKQLQFIFSSEVKQCTPKLKNTCLCLIKPHIIQQRKAGALISELLKNNVTINCMKFQTLDWNLTQSYLYLYKFLPEYQQNLLHFSSGASIYMQISIPSSKNTPQQFKKLCGPYDPSYAKKISPQSLRGKFGTNRVLNAVHCTQLYEDAESQIKIIFQM